MKKWHRIVGGVSVAVYGLGALVGFGTLVYMGYQNEKKTSAATFESEREKGRAEWSDCVYLFTDPETKVQYIYFFSCGKAGICPRYTADGRLYVENGKNKSASF